MGYMKQASMRSGILILATAQALIQTVSVLVVTIGGLAGAVISDRPELATVPVAAMFLGTAVATFPASHLMAKAGRRAGFMAGAAIGAIGGIIAALGMWLSLLPVVALGTFLVGCYQGFAQFYRFAASEIANEAFRPKAISLVLAGGLGAAFLGPYLGRVGGPLLEQAYVGSFLILALAALLAFVVLAGLRMPVQVVDQVDTSRGRSWGAIVSQPPYLVALFGAVTGYTIMIMIMTATPMAMIRQGYDLSAAAMVIQLHVIGMFLPSFFTGNLIKRFGVLQIMLSGVVLLVCQVLMTFTGDGIESFAVALILLGVGWNFLYIGGTTLLTTTYTPAEKSRAQATNDMTIFVAGLAGSFGAAGMLDGLGWQALNGYWLPWLAVAGLAIAWLMLRERRLKMEARAFDSGGSGSMENAS